MQTIALLITALLFGGMALFAGGFAAVLFASLPAAAAGAVLRRAFAHFYLFVLVTAAIGSVLLLPRDGLSAALLAALALSTVPTRQMLMPAINAATDAGARARFRRLHALSVAITLAHIACAGYVLTRFL